MKIFFLSVNLKSQTYSLMVSMSPYFGKSLPKLKKVKIPLIAVLKCFALLMGKYQRSGIQHMPKAQMAFGGKYG